MNRAPASPKQSALHPGNAASLERKPGPDATSGWEVVDKDPTRHKQTRCGWHMPLACAGPAGSVPGNVARAPPTPRAAGPTTPAPGGRGGGRPGRTTALDGSGLRGHWEGADNTKMQATGHTVLAVLP